MDLDKKITTEALLGFISSLDDTLQCIDGYQELLLEWSNPAGIQLVVVLDWLGHECQLGISDATLKGLHLLAETGVLILYLLMPVINT